MKVVISLSLTLLTAVLGVVFSTPGRAGRVETTDFSRGNPHAKIEYCEDCHGSSGQGYVGYLIMPRLAGQTAAYLESQLRAFVERRRGSDIFINMARTHNVGPGTRTALALHFEAVNSRPFGGAPRHLIGMGKKIYEDGVPDANVPACTACHGAEAKGQELNPRLAGQLYPYLITRLIKLRSEPSRESANAAASATMARVARRMTRAQMAAVAAYLSNLR